jgi:hypothetical protein
MLFFWSSMCNVQRARVVCEDNYPGRRNVDVYLFQGDQHNRGECAHEQAADVHRRDGLAAFSSTTAERTDGASSRKQIFLDTFVYTANTQGVKYFFELTDIPWKERMPCSQ